MSGRVSCRREDGQEGRQAWGQTRTPGGTSPTTATWRSSGGWWSRPPTRPTTRTPTPSSRASSCTASGRAPPRTARRRRSAGRCRPRSPALADGPGVVVVRGAFPDPAVVDRVTDVLDALLAEERSAAARRATPSPPRAPTSGSGARWTSSPCVTRWSGPGAGRRWRTATTTWASMSREQALAYPPTSTGSRGRCRARWPTAPCRWSRGRRCSSRTRRSSGRATSPSRSRRATPCSSTPRCSTAPGRTGRPTSAGRRTCCRCRRRSAGPWRRSTARRCARRCSPSCSSNGRRASRIGGCATSSRRPAEGYAFPTDLDRDQPVGGLAPETQAELVWRALQQGWPAGTLAKELDALAAPLRADPALTLPSPS